MWAPPLAGPPICDYIRKLFTSEDLVPRNLGPAWKSELFNGQLSEIIFLPLESRKAASIHGLKHTKVTVVSLLILKNA